jgi:hypothetical protein
MRQIGMRQEASRLGGIGSCGRELCCSTWLTDFKTVSTAAARYQNLSLNTLKLAGQCGKLKCCLNYELDTYMDALKHIPDNVNVLRTEKGDARLQKTDIFKKIMWFSYPREENWIPMPISKVKEIQQQNKEGIIPADLGEFVEAETKQVAKVLDYENVVGQDSLTRLDERRNNNNNKKKSKNKNTRNPNQNPQQPNQPRPANVVQNTRSPRPESAKQDVNRPEGNRPQQQANRPVDGNRAEGANPEGGKPQGSNPNRRNKHRRPNQNNQPRPGGNPGPTAE